MSSRSTEDVGGGDRARSAVVRHMAATSMARDTSLPEAERYQALKYLVGESNAMQHGSFDAPKDGAFDSGAKSIASPKNATGVAPAMLRAQANHATQGNEGLSGPSEHIDKKAQVGLSSNHGAAGAAADGRLSGFKVPDGAGASDAVDAGMNKAKHAGLADGDGAKNVLSRTWAGWFHGDTAGAPGHTAPATAAANDGHETNPKK